jgi:hypothetical protein
MNNAVNNNIHLNNKHYKYVSTRLEIQVQEIAHLSVV